jgi:chromosome segregation ATPase
MLSLKKPMLTGRSYTRSRANATAMCNESPNKYFDTEIKKIKSKQRRDIVYIKKNMNKRFKRIIKEIKESSNKELASQDDNHKKAVMKVTKNWTEEKLSLEDRARDAEQENNFLRNELNEYKSSHDSMIKEIERLKKIIDEVEDENDAYKEHITTQVNIENERRENKCEECLQTDFLISARKSNKNVGASMRSSISGCRQDSFPNLVTLEPNDIYKSVHISTASNCEPTNDLQTGRSFLKNPIIVQVIFLHCNILELPLQEYVNN